MSGDRPEPTKHFESIGGTAEGTIDHAQEAAERQRTRETSGGTPSGALVRDAGGGLPAKWDPEAYREAHARREREIPEHEARTLEHITVARGLMPGEIEVLRERAEQKAPPLGALVRGGRQRTPI